MTRRGASEDHHEYASRLADHVDGFSRMQTGLHIQPLGWRIDFDFDDGRRAYRVSVIDLGPKLLGD